MPLVIIHSYSILYIGIIPTIIFSKEMIGKVVGTRSYIHCTSII